MTAVKGHSRKSSGGGVILVKRYDRTTDLKAKPTKDSEDESFFGIAEKSMIAKARRVIQSKTKASHILARYSKYPRNLSVMTNGKWKKQDGKFVIDVSQKELTKIIKENAPLVGEIMKRMYAKNASDYRDMKAVAITSIYNALSYYGSKFNPKDPPDIANHIRNYIEGSIKRDMMNLYSVDYSLPMNYRLLFMKYKEAYSKFEGDDRSIFNFLKVKKSDVYRNSDGSDELLPMDDYVNEKRKGAFEKKLKGYEKKISDIRGDYEIELGTIDKKSQIGYSDDEKDLFDIGVKEIEKDVDSARKLAHKLNFSFAATASDFVEKIETLENQIKKEEVALENNPNRKNTSLVKLSNSLMRSQGQYSRFKIGDDKKRVDSAMDAFDEHVDRLSQFRDSMEPRSDADIQALKLEAYDTYSQKMKAARADHDKDISKTFQMGYRSLSKVFKEMLNSGRVDLSAFDDGDNVGAGIENVADKDSEKDVKQIETEQSDLNLKADYEKARQKFEAKIDLFDPITRDVIKMRLGFHEQNVPQEHGLSGHPMDFKDIVQRLPDAYFVRDNSAYQYDVDKWMKGKPSDKIKKSDKEFRVDSKSYDNRLKVARKQVDILADKSPKKSKADIRVELYAKMKVTKSDRPTKFKVVEGKEYKNLVSQWKKKKPVPYLISQNNKSSFLTGKFKAATTVLKNMMSKDDVHHFIDMHNQMIERGIEKADCEYTLLKSITSIIYGEPIFLN